MTPSKLQSLTVKELRALAATHGVVNAQRMLKAELVAALATKAGGSSSNEGTGTRERARRKASFTAPDNSASGAVHNAPSSKPMQAPAPAKVDAPAGTDPGLPIPDRYGTDRLVLMVQDPHHIFAYWELTPHTLDQARLLASGGTPVLVLHGANGDECREVDLHGGNYYLSVAPSAAYEAELALRDGQGRLHVLARSNRVSTPAPSISAHAGEQWLGVDETFHELLELAGLPDQVASGGGSVQRLSMKEQRLVAWGWKESGVQPFSSGVLSSHSLTSSGLVRKNGGIK